MNREEFCKVLQDGRKESDKSWLDLTIATHLNQSAIQKVINGDTNFFVESVLKIANALGMSIVVIRNEEITVIDTLEALTHWVQRSQQESGLSVNKFKDEIGLTRVAVTANLKGESRMRIDTFLKWAEVTGWSVEVTMTKSK